MRRFAGVVALVRRLVGAVMTSSLVLASLLGPAQSRAQNAAEERSASSANFTITWDEADLRTQADADGGGVPDSVESILGGFESARSALATLGYPVDLGHESYPLFLAQSEGRGFARAYPGETDSRRSFVVVPPRMTNPDLEPQAVEIFAVHEYFHAVQFYLDYDEAGWLREASSTWAEDLVYDSADPNHQALAHFVPFPQLSLTSTSGEAEYGAFLFLQFLTERYGGGSEVGAGLIHRWWQLMAVPGTIEGAGDLEAFPALGQVLAEVGTTLPEAWGEFLLWRRQLGLFEEGSAYKALPPLSGWPVVSRIDNVTDESCRLASPELPPLSGAYFSLRADSGAEAGTWRLSVDGPVNTTGFLRTKLRGLSAETRAIATDAQGAAQLDLAIDPRQLKRLILGLGDASTTGFAQPLAYSLRSPSANEVEVPAPSGSSSVQFGTASFLSGEVLCGGAAAPFASVNLIAQESVSGTMSTTPLVTDENGRWSLVVSPDANSIYRVEVVDPLISSRTSEQKRLDVQLFVTIDAPATHNSLSAPYRISGTVSPEHEGAMMSLQIRRPGRDAWREVAATSVDASGNYAESFRFPASGTWEVRSVVVSTGDEDHEPGTSITELVEVAE